MQPFFADFFERLNEQHEGFKEALEGLPPQALDWRPGPEMNSITVLVTHTAGAQRYWIGEMVGQDPAGRHRPSEFEAGNQSAESITSRLDEVLAHSRQVLTELTMEDLPEIRHASLFDENVSVAWCLAHALDHTALHLGHVQITRQLWDQQG
jgi:uncharacterized damage-inducible protein DinB